MDENLIYNCLKIIEENFDTEIFDNQDSASCMWILHEKCFFDTQKYNELMNAIIHLIRLRCKNFDQYNKIDFNGILYKISNIFNWLLEHLIWHYNNSDAFKIVNFDTSDFSIIGSYMIDLG